MKTAYILVPVKVRYVEPDDETIEVSSVETPSFEDCQLAYGEHRASLHNTKESCFKDLF